MELFDLVDKHDRVIGETNKVVAHANGDIHRVAAVYVFDIDGRLYVQNHKKSGLFDHSVGGHIQKDETYEAGAAREAEEELGLTQRLDKLDIFYSDEGPTMQHMFGLFRCYADPSWSFVPNDEVGVVFSMNVDEIRVLMKESPEKFTPGFLNTMQHYIHLNETG
jgi:isopentenyl-diphosphate delta-isomerase